MRRIGLVILLVLALFWLVSCEKTNGISVQEIEKLEDQIEDEVRVQGIQVICKIKDFDGNGKYDYAFYIGWTEDLIQKTISPFSSKSFRPEFKIEKVLVKLSPDWMSDRVYWCNAHNKRCEAYTFVESIKSCFSRYGPHYDYESSNIWVCIGRDTRTFSPRAIE